MRGKYQTFPFFSFFCSLNGKVAVASPYVRHLPPATFLSSSSFFLQAELQLLGHKRSLLFKKLKENITVNI